jgi:hypothetical protein
MPFMGLNVIINIATPVLVALGLFITWQLSQKRIQHPTAGYLVAK